MNKNQKSKTALMVFGILVCLLSIAFIIGGVITLLKAFDHGDDKVLKLVIAIIFIVLGLFGIVFGIIFTWTAGAVTATKGSQKQEIIGKGTIGVTKCIHCGTEVDSLNGFCPNCGNNLSGTVVCEECNTVNSQTDKYCVKCGHDLK